MNILTNQRGSTDSTLLSSRNHLALAKALGILLGLGTSLPIQAENSDPATVSRAGNSNIQSSDVASKAPQTDQNTPRFFVKKYRIDGGGHLLPRVEMEAAVYPYLGPYRTAADVEQARAALEEAYRDKGYQTVTVQIPQQQVASGEIVLEVMQGEVGRLRVHGSRYFSIDQIKREAPSLQEGQSPNFSQVTHDLLVLNDISDRRVTPTVRPGETPGTVDVDLNVKDTPPVHGSLEINNRYSADTTPLRINGSVSYDNLWQLEHSVGFSFQVSPEDPSQVKVFSGYYLARLPDVSWLSLMLQGTEQDSSVNTLGGIGVVGKGQIVGGRAIIALPTLHDFNLAFDRAGIESEGPAILPGPQNNNNGSSFAGGGQGYDVQLSLGAPALEKLWDWNVNLAYRYVESDAVVDAFTDTDFGGYLAGTNLKGYIVGGNLALSKRIWSSLKFISADAIAGPPLKTEVIQVDLNAKF